MYFARASLVREYELSVIGYEFWLQLIFLTDFLIVASETFKLSKVFDKDILERWKNEMSANNNWNKHFPAGNLQYGLQKFNYAVAKTQWRDRQWNQNHKESRPAAVDGVYCQQTMTDDALRRCLVQEIGVLCQRPAISSDREDRHPGTKQMIDLVHPSLYCFERGKTHVLPHAGAEVLEQPSNWKEFLGSGVASCKSTESAPPDAADSNDDDSLWFTAGAFQSQDRLQWLPAEFYVNGTGNKCDIKSYINNLHPENDKHLYESISELFLEALPLLEDALTESNRNRDHPNLSLASDDAIAGKEEGTDVAFFGYKRQEIHRGPPARPI